MRKYRPECESRRRQFIIALPAAVAVSPCPRDVAPWQICAGSAYHHHVETLRAWPAGRLASGSAPR
jgi:hypothetical protein